VGDRTRSRPGAVSGRGISRLAATLRAAPVAGRALRAARGPCDRVLMALDRPPFSVAVDDHVLAGFLRHRGYLAQLETYEDYARELFRGALGPGAIVIDGGAHLGLYTLTASGPIGAAGRVYAFEADPYNVRALRLNVRRNGLRNVDVVARALSDDVGASSYYVSSGTIASSLVNKHYVRDADEITVQTTTIDAALGPAVAALLVVKLDLEGAEERVLRGARRTLGSCATGYVLLEHNPSALADGGSSAAAVIDLLRELGYTPYVIDERRRALVAISATGVPTEKGNLWAVKDA
jgi:FkbM family methyltransferase